MGKRGGRGEEGRWKCCKKKIWLRPIVEMERSTDLGNHADNMSIGILTNCRLNRVRVLNSSIKVNFKPISGEGGGGETTCPQEG